MDEADIVELRFFIIGILGMFFLALGIVIFVIIYQRKLLAQQQAMEAANIQYQQELLQASLDAQEKERIRIGRDLHDDIGAMLSTARLYLQQSKAEKAGINPQQWIEKTDEILIQSAKELHNISRDLLPTILTQMGLQEAIEGLCDIAREHGILVSFFYAPSLPALSDQTALSFYRITQELINNSLKHAEADKLALTMKIEGEDFMFSYADNGKGMRVEQVKENSGLGLKNIESRINLLNGKLSFPEVEKGMAMKMIIPLNNL